MNVTALPAALFDDNFVRRRFSRAGFERTRSTRTVRFVELVALHASKRLPDQPVCLVERHAGVLHSWTIRAQVAGDRGADLVSILENGKGNSCIEKGERR